jgi:hypothetical protein
MWNTTYLSSLRDEAASLNHVVLSGMPTENPIFVSKAEDFENGVRLQHLEHSKVFNRGTKFSPSVVCTVGAKVMFLTNSMLSDKGISNGSIGVITNLLPGDEVEAAFPTKDGIQVSSPTSILRDRRTLTALILNRRAADRRPQLMYLRSCTCTKHHRISRRMGWSINVCSFQLLTHLR